MKNKLLILFAFLSIGFASCDLGDDPAIGGTATQALAGEYFIQLLSSPGGAVFLDYTQWTISNTAANVPDKIRITDNDHVWGFSGVFNSDVNSLTFSGDSIPNPSYGGEAVPAAMPFQAVGTIDTVLSGVPRYMTITEGKILKGVAHVPSNTIADSIAFFATGHYQASSYMVVGHTYDTVTVDPLVIDTLSVFEYIQTFGAEDGPYFMSGYKRTGFLEDEH
jgi:hypothetical protein